MITDQNDPWKIIHTYTRAQAIDDGVLVDVSEPASHEGFIIPVAVTSAVWHAYIEWTDEDTNKQIVQKKENRLSNVLWMLYLAIKKNKSTDDYILYELYVVPRDGQTKKAELIKLKSLIHAGDNGEAVITIMLPHED